jgi:hypothetical protein
MFGFFGLSDKDYFNSLDIFNLFSYYLTLRYRKERDILSPEQDDDLRRVEKALKKRQFEEKADLYHGIGGEHFREYLELYEEDIPSLWSYLDGRKASLVWKKIAFPGTAQPAVKP